jgi:riboflavin synthase
MFTGIITGVGRIAAVDDLGSSDQHGKRLTIETPAGYLEDVGLGDSIALNGACMTVTSLDASAHRFTIDISAESLDKTAGLTDPAPSTSKRHCARRTAWAATWSPATSTASAAC